MVKGIRRVVIGYGRQAREVKIEFPGGMAFIKCGLTNNAGKDVVNVSVSADGDRYAGEGKWWCEQTTGNRDGIACLIVKED